MVLVRSLSGSTTVQGITLHAVIGLGLVASILLDACMFRDRVAG